MRNVLLILAPLLVAVVAYFTYVRHYDEPNNFFWDENYHVAAAQKYLNGIFFMEPHAPLGKLLIALGERVIRSNPIDDQFISTDYAKNAPPNFSLRGYRVVPVLCAWLAALLLYALFLEITKRPVWAMLLSSLYIFDNAIIVHSRGAMLDSIQFLFIVATLLLTLRIRNGQRDLLTCALLGIMFGAGVAAKENGILLAPALLLPLWSLPCTLRSYGKYLTTVSLFTVITFVSVWWIALALSNTINPKLEKDGWYKASPELKQAIVAHSRSPRTLYYFVRDSLSFAEEYHARVPELNYCKVGENGSYPLFWPLGARSINYRWQKVNEQAEYLYLQVNPAIWFVALLSIVAATALCVTRLLGQRRTMLAHEDVLITLVILYALYFGAVLSVNRVFYLYHYFVPLLYCFVVSAILVTDLGVSSVYGTKIKSGMLAFMTAVVIGAFYFYSPLTYYKPIAENEFKKRALLRMWDLTWLTQARTDPIGHAEVAAPVTKEQHQLAPDLYISGVRARSVSQQWGEAKQNATIDGNPLVIAGKSYAEGLGVHAASTIEFSLNRKFVRFTALVGIPDDVVGGSASVRFAIRADDKEIWNSGPMTSGAPVIPVDLEIKNVSTLSLIVTPIAKTIDFDHACWLSPHLEPLVVSPTPTQ